jgi:hypothetical protein
MDVLTKATDDMLSDLTDTTDVTMTVSRQTSFNGEDTSLYNLLATYLPLIADDKVSITLDGDAGRLFRLMQREQARNTQLVGV